jgi:hypothetical protein
VEAAGWPDIANKCAGGLHPHQFELAQSDRTLVCRTQREGRAPRRLHCVRDLQRTITEFLKVWSANPMPYVWAASVERIFQKIARARQRLEQIEQRRTQPKRHART